MFSPRLIRTILLVLLAASTISRTSAQKYSVLYSFTGGADGASPKGALVLDSAGNLYGTTQGSNPYPNSQTTGTTAGSVFKINSSGEFTLLYNFGQGGTNGTSPSGGLVRDPAGNLFGATSGGGPSTNPSCFAGGLHPSLPLNGCGEVFKIDGNGQFSVFHGFSGTSYCWTGCFPLAPLTLDSAGNLYGSTYIGGSRNCDWDNLNRQGFFLNSNCGTVFKLDPKGRETVLHRFGNSKKDGDYPNPGLILDAAGNLYGTTLEGGINSNGGNGGAGTIFKIDPAGHETVLFYFEEFVSGYYPNGGLVLDSAGNIFGTTQGFAGGAGQNGAFRLDSQGSLTQFAPISDTPLSGLIVDGLGNFYGTTIDGGNSAPICGYFGNAECGTIFKLDPSGNKTTLYNFSGTDGATPYASLVMDAAGNLYGTTAYGGTFNSNCPAGCGVVFKITP